MLISIETHRICDFPDRGPDPLLPSGSAHGFSFMEINCSL